MNQKLIIISGSPCVGKTAVAEKLFKKYNNSAYCDGDWMWCVNPFSVEDPRLRNGDKNMSFVLSTYLKSQFDYVFFSSVVVMYKEIRESIINDIDYEKFDLLGFSLICSEETLYQRHGKRGDNNEVSYEWLRLGPYKGDYVIDTDNKSINEICEEMSIIID